MTGGTPAPSATPAPEERAPNAAPAPASPVTDRMEAGVPTGFAEHAEAIRAAVGHVLQAKLDLLRAQARQALLGVILSAVVVVVVITLIVIAMVMLLSGLAGGLGELLGNRAWLGEVIVALLTITAIYVAFRWRSTRADRKRVAALAEKYEKNDARLIPVQDGSTTDAVPRDHLS